jgi:hypothetical protein
MYESRSPPLKAAADAGAAECDYCDGGRGMGWAGYGSAADLTYSCRFAQQELSSTKNGSAGSRNCGGGEDAGACVLVCINACT